MLSRYPLRRRARPRSSSLRTSAVLAACLGAKQYVDGTLKPVLWTQIGQYEQKSYQRTDLQANPRKAHEQTHAEVLPENMLGESSYCYAQMLSSLLRFGT